MTLPLRKLVALLAVCALALGAAACGGDSDDSTTSADVPADAIALVGGTAVPKDEFDALMEQVKSGYEQQGRTFPKVGTPEYQNLKSEAVTYLVQRYEYRREAQALGIEVTDAQVDKRLEDVKKQQYGGSDQKFQAALKQLGLTEAEARESIRDRLTQEEIYKKVTEKATVTDAEIQKYYDENKTQFAEPFKVRHILVKTKAKAEEVAKKIDGGASFATVARAESTDTGTVKKGGLLTVQPGQVVQEFYDAAVKLKPGEVSEPVKSQFGWHLIQDVTAASYQPLSQAKPSIEEQLKQQEQTQAMDTWMKQVKDKYDSEVVYAVGYKPTSTTSTQTTTQ